MGVTERTPLNGSPSSPEDNIQTHGPNLRDLFRKLRLAHARRLLERSDKAISDICYEVGFSNLSNFNRHFLNDAGETPRQFRQRVQN